MTEIAFHFNLPDKTAYLCRLLRKAVAHGARVAVSGDQLLMTELDKALWSFSATDFVPHCLASSDSAIVNASPVVLGVDASAAPHHDVLLNLAEDVPAGFERFNRVIEVVGDGVQDRSMSRRRWKHYEDRGYSIVRHDLARKGAD